MLQKQSFSFGVAVNHKICSESEIAFRWNILEAKRYNITKVSCNAGTTSRSVFSPVHKRLTCESIAPIPDEQSDRGIIVPI